MESHGKQLDEILSFVHRELDKDFIFEVMKQLHRSTNFPLPLQVDLTVGSVSESLKSLRGPQKKAFLVHIHEEKIPALKNVTKWFKIHLQDSASGTFEYVNIEFLPIFLFLKQYSVFSQVCHPSRQEPHTVSPEGLIEDQEKLEGQDGAQGAERHLTTDFPQVHCEAHPHHSCGARKSLQQGSQCS